jgi:hypothetical protein
MVGAPKHVAYAIDAGVDIICCQGGEGGGHTGNVPTSILVPACVDACKGRKSPLTGEPVSLTFRNVSSRLPFPDLTPRLRSTSSPLEVLPMVEVLPLLLCGARKPSGVSDLSFFLISFSKTRLPADLSSPPLHFLSRNSIRRRYRGFCSSQAQGAHLDCRLRRCREDSDLRESLSLGASIFACQTCSFFPSLLRLDDLSESDTPPTSVIGTRTELPRSRTLPERESFLTSASSRAIPRSRWRDGEFPLFLLDHGSFSTTSLTPRLSSSDLG